MKNIINEDGNKELSDRRYYANLYISEQINKRKKDLLFGFFLTIICTIFCYVLFNINGEISFLFIISALCAVFASFDIIVTIFKRIPKLLKYKKMIYSTDLDLERVENVISIQKYKFKKAQEEAKNRQEEFQAQQAEMQERKNAIEHPECPMCKSRNTKRISTINRTASVATLGLASSKIGKQFECLNCKYKW